MLFLKTATNLKSGFAALLAILSITLLPVTSSAEEAEGSGLDDPAIFAIYDQVNGFDIETAMLGVVRGQSPDVRALAGMVLRDHSTVLQMTRGLAGNLGVSYEVDPTNEAAQNHAKNLAALKSIPDAEFDAAYLRYETEFHTTAIDAVNTVLLPAIENEDLKALVQAVLPGFEMHLAETIATAKKLGVQ